MRKRSQQLHFVMSDVYERLVPANHFLRKLNNALDLSFVEKLCSEKYLSANGGPGRPAEPPVRLFKLLLLMFLYQVKFERELERRANDTISWRWFCGYAPDESVASHKTLWLFRKRLGPDVFDNIFAAILEKCICSGLVDNRRWHVDATKQDASATKFSKFEIAIILTRAMIERLESMQGVEQGDTGAPPAEIDDEMKVLVSTAACKAAKLKSFNPRRVLARAFDEEYEPTVDAEDGSDCSDTDVRSSEFDELAHKINKELAPCRGDKDARIGHTSVTGTFCGYLTTVVLDEKNGIVLGYETVVGNVDQGTTFIPAYENALKMTNAPCELAADSAFDELDIRKRLDSDGVVGYIAMQKSRSQGGVFGSKKFGVRSDGNSYCIECPAKNLMKQVCVTKEGYYLFDGVGCAECDLRCKCTNAKDGVRTFRFRPDLREFQEKQWLLCKTDEYKAAMKARMATIEPRFGHGKTYHNLGKCIYRSVQMNRIHSAISLAVLNLEKLVSYGKMTLQST